MSIFWTTSARKKADSKRKYRVNSKELTEVNNVISG